MEALEDKIKQFLQTGSGYGYGSGSGDGFGDGSGYGSGDGDGYGYGSGDGSGDGDGSGYGDDFGSGYGSGSGSGYGYGSGDGDGSGDGSGYGIKSINGEPIFPVDGVPTIIRSVHRHFAIGAILQKNLTLVPTYLSKVGNFFAHGSTLREAHEQAQAKALQNEPIEMRIERFRVQYPDINKKIPAMELFHWHHILTGSCELGRRTFARDKDINLDTDEFTVEEFVNITCNAYGGEIIKKLIE